MVFSANEKSLKCRWQSTLNAVCTYFEVPPTNLLLDGRFWQYWFYIPVYWVASWSEPEPFLLPWPSPQGAAFAPGAYQLAVPVHCREKTKNSNVIMLCNLRNFKLATSYSDLALHQVSAWMTGRQWVFRVLYNVVLGWAEFCSLTSRISTDDAWWCSPDLNQQKVLYKCYSVIIFQVQSQMNNSTSNQKVRHKPLGNQDTTPLGRVSSTVSAY